VLDLLANADALIEGFSSRRDGTSRARARRGAGAQSAAGLWPHDRMGQQGPLAQAAGHDINYISVTGALAAIGTKDRPVPPLNLVGDFGGGALYLVVGVLAALLEASRSGKGQVVRCRDVRRRAASLMSMVLRHGGRRARWTEQRESEFPRRGAHFYGVYECGMGRFISIGSIETAILRVAAPARRPLRTPTSITQMDRKAWPALKAKTGGCIQDQEPATSGARSWRVPTSASRRS